MNKTKVLALLFMLLSAPAVMYADFIDFVARLEFGPAVGAGLYIGPKNPYVKGADGVSVAPSLVRDQAYTRMGEFGLPASEAFGLQVGYRFDMRWQVQLKTMRQRISFYEFNEASNYTGLYYNGMWHLDAMAEFNIFHYGNRMDWEAKIFNVVPYVGLGIGCTMYNKNAALRSIPKWTDNNYINTMFPMVGKDYLGKDDKGNVRVENAGVAAALYVPVALGVKWRINDNVQLIGSAQCNVYFVNGILEGSTNAGYYNGGEHGYGHPTAIDVRTRPTFDQLNNSITANCLFSISAIFNLERWQEERMVY